MSSITMKYRLEDVINLVQTIARFDRGRNGRFTYWLAALRGHHTRSTYCLCRTNNVKHDKFAFNGTKYVVLL